jgi:hypothetical protein
LVNQRGLLRSTSACDSGAVEANATISDVIFRDGFE